MNSITKTIFWALFLNLMITASLSYASMKLYISDDCGNCKEVMEEAKETIDELKAKGKLEVVNITGAKTDLPAVPALVDGDKVIVGTGIKEYLEEKVRPELFRDSRFNDK